VDIHIMMQPPNVDWTFYGTEVTDNNGRVTFNIPDDKRLPQGMYPVKVRWQQLQNAASLFIKDLVVSWLLIFYF
jgi:5-hydroxyisourate hydrolase-like protein (transthyretin family)